MNVKITVFSLAALLVFLTAALLLFRYTYTQTDYNGIPIALRTDRLTGRVEMNIGDGWEPYLAGEKKANP